MSQNNLKILLVDDVAFFRDVMCDYFKRTPASVITASSGEEAIEIAKREWPDLIYMDVAMPGMSGIEACKKIKAHPTLKKIPVLLVFTPDRDATTKEVESSMCDGYLPKPFGREQFLNLGHRYLFNIERRERRVRPCHDPCGVESVVERARFGQILHLAERGKDEHVGKHERAAVHHL